MILIAENERIMEKIYIADDDRDILRLLKVCLENEGYDVEDFGTGDELYEKFLEDEPDLVILDIMMPGTDGLSICENIRKISDVPIILLTAKDSDADYVMGISLGSDDYLTKPFNLTVLTMKVKALLRRVKMSTEKRVEEVVVLDLRCVEKERSIFCNDTPIELTKTEFECLYYMMRRFGEAISREDLLDEVWGIDKAVETRVTDETIRKIRKKLREHDSRAIIKNKWGFGYSLEERA